MSIGLTNRGIRSLYVGACVQLKLVTTVVTVSGYRMSDASERIWLAITVWWGLLICWLNYIIIIIIINYYYK